MRKLLALLLFCNVFHTAATAQCKLAMKEVDPFDNTLLVAAQPMSIGYKIPSQYTQPDGNLRMIDEGKLLFSYTENDTINSFFLTLGLAEHAYYTVEEGYTVMLLLSNQKVIALYNVPDRGQFNSDINMRIYQHTCVVPLDMFYVLTYLKVEKIRIEYKGYKKTLEILPTQQDAILEAVRCVGEGAGLYPVKP
ncbi:MAG TPA: hypothetical protein PKC76_10930 [Saprospiraceae bacterium]|nr:hypothetical protein [Saprospiraceae bacterium]HMP24639.1 hypothetical protein [Saprospiraceae bacterium]